MRNWIRRPIARQTQQQARAQTLKPELAKTLAARRASEKHTAEAREDP
jgi:hypothetical protein